MLEKLNFEKGSSILIPSWNNLEYLSFCIESIKKNSYYKHEILVHLNESRIDEAKSLLSKEIKFTASPDNIGICKSLNNLAKIATKDIIGYFNDDMVALPEWDLELQKFANNHNCDENWVLASTMIEPKGNNPCCIAPYDSGTDIQSFLEKEDNLIKSLPVLKSSSFSVIGSTWPPNFLHKNLWNKIGGYDEDYNVGFGSDPDLIKRCYDVGCRNFIGVGSSLVYHFQCKTTNKIKHLNLGKDSGQLFKNKHGIDMMDFINNILKRGHIFDESK